MDNRERGKACELIAAQFLKDQGCKVLQRNASYRGGELDLIMTDGAQLVFVEVRYRRHQAWGGALESVDYRKRRKLILAARLWLMQHPRFADSTCRFDLVTINSAEVPAECVWYKDAFRPE